MSVFLRAFFNPLSPNDSSSGGGAPTGGGAAVSSTDENSPPQTPQGSGAPQTAYDAEKVAEALLARGFHIFPLTPGDKRPLLGTRGFHEASTAPKQITQWLEFTPKANWGLRTGGGLVVLDVDVASDKPGARSLEELTAEHGVLPYTLTVRTPTGGLHYYFTSEESLPRRIDFRPGLDFLGEGGYAVAPGSVRPQGRYEIVVDTEPAPLPEWLAELVTPPAAPIVPTYRKVQLQPGEKGRLSRATLEFLTFGVDTGWNAALFKAAKDYQEQGYALEEATKELERATKSGCRGAIGRLDKSDLATIRSAFAREPKYEPRDVSIDANPFAARDQVPSRDITSAEGKSRRHYPVDECVEYWFRATKAEYRYKGDIVRFPFGILSGEEVINRIALNSQNAAVPLQLAYIPKAVAMWTKRKQDEIIQQHRSVVEYDRALGDKELAKWLRAVVGPAAERFDLDLAAMKQFIWQVKRKLTGREVNQHLFVVLYGAQDLGKTRAMHRLLQPINELTHELTDLSVLNDNRELGLLARSFVVFVDEMARASAADMAKLKNIVTSPVINQRVMNTTLHSSKTNNATFIGAANMEVQDIFYDPSGVRRFWQINCAPRIDWAAVNSVDALAIWRSVDESDENYPVKAVWPQMKAIQHEEFRQKDSVELFNDELEPAAEPMLARDIYPYYVEFCRKTGQSAMNVFSLQKFSRVLAKYRPVEKVEGKQNGFKVVPSEYLEKLQNPFAYELKKKQEGERKKAGNE